MPLLILGVALLSSFISKTTGSLKKFEGTIPGRWKLEAYGYNPKGVEMEFDILKETVSYTFAANFTGNISATIDNSKEITEFIWTLEKKDRLTIRTEDEIKHYRIRMLTKSEFVIVDQQGGTDAYKTYTAGEKGLIFGRSGD